MKSDGRGRGSFGVVKGGWVAPFAHGRAMIQRGSSGPSPLASTCLTGQRFGRTISAVAHARARPLRPVHQQPRQLVAGVLGQTERADVVVRRRAVVAELHRQLHRRLRVGLKEAEEVVAADEVDLRRHQRLRGDLVRLAEHRRAHAEDLARLDDVDDQRPPGGGEHRLLHPAAAEDVDAARLLAFHEEQRALRLDDRVRDRAQLGDRLIAQAAEGPLGPDRAFGAVVVDVEVVRCGHGAHPFVQR